MARRKQAKEENQQQAYQEKVDVVYSRPVTFDAFLQALLTNTKYNKIMKARKDDKQWKQLCQSTLCFTHFVQLYDYRPSKEALHEVRKRVAAILTRPTEPAIDVILILQNGEELSPVTISVVGTDSKLRNEPVGGEARTEWLKKFNNARVNLDLTPPSLGILQQFGIDSAQPEFIQDNCLDLRGLDMSVYRLFEDGNVDGRKVMFDLLKDMLNCSNDALANELQTQEHLPVMYEAWAKACGLPLAPPAKKTTAVKIPAVELSDGETVTVETEGTDA
jgi:hypothetical protein